MTLVDAYTNKGNSIIEVSKEHKVILVFLRHFGCNFCRETLGEIEKLNKNIKKENSRIILVHQSSRKYANEFLAIYDLEDVEHVSDSGYILYRAFGLTNHGFLELLKPSVLMGIFRSLFKGHFFGKLQGSPTQLPGIFVIEKGEVVDFFRYRNIAQMPPLLELAS